MGLFDVGKAEKFFWEVVGKSKENNLLSKLDRVEAQNLKGSSLVTNLTDKFKDIPIELDNNKLERLLGNNGMVYLLSTRPHTTSSSNFVKLVKSKVVNSKVLSDYLSNEKPVPMGTPMPNDIKNIKASLIRYLKLTDKEETDQDIVALKQDGASEEDLKIKLKRNKNEDAAEKMQSHRKVNRLKVMVTALLIYLIDRAYGRSQMIFDPAGPSEQPKEPVNKKPSQNSTRTSVQHGTTDVEQDLIEKLANGTATKAEFENLSAEMCGKLKKLVIPDGVEEVPGEFYSRLKKLESLTIPGSFKQWIRHFCVCENLKEIIAKEGAGGIINLSFHRHKNLIKIVIPGSAETIGWQAFSNCRNLAEVTIGSGVKTIEDKAFERCNKLSKIVIPGSVETIGSEAFSNCQNLAEVTIESGVKTIGERAFVFCKALKKITIPSSVETISSAAFISCENLSDVTIENGVKSIGEMAFRFCKKLGKIVIPGSVKTIGKDAFSNCDNLSDVTIENGVETIGEGAFNLCKNLNRIVIPSSVKTIKAGGVCVAFEKCPKNMKIEGDASDEIKSIIRRQIGD